MPPWIGPGPVERVQRGEIFQPRGLVAAQNIAHAGRFELEHAAGKAFAENLVGVGVVERQVFGHQLDAVVLLDQLQRVVDEGERGEAQKVHLEKRSFSRPTMSYCVTISSLLVL